MSSLLQYQTNTFIVHHHRFLKFNVFVVFSLMYVVKVWKGFVVTLEQS